MWVKNLTQSILENNGIVISFEDDKLYQGGIVLKKVISFPEGEWSLDSLAEIEADTGLIPTTLGPAFVAFNKTLVSDRKSVV